MRSGWSDPPTAGCCAPTAACAVADVLVEDGTIAALRAGLDAPVEAERLNADGDAGRARA